MIGMGALPPELEIKQLKAENARLRAELEKLRPKPVVNECYLEVRLGDDYRRLSLSGLKESRHGLDNIKLTFENGKLVGAEVINRGETK